VWELTQGKDFPGRIVGFIQTLAGHAKRRGGRVRSAKLEDGKRIVIQFIPDEQGGERKE
jgi:hypothetical protein